MLRIGFQWNQSLRIILRIPVKLLTLANSTRTTNHTAEGFSYGILVTSILATLRMVDRALATTSAYTVVVRSGWGRDTIKMEGNGKEAQSTRQMERRRSMTSDFVFLIISLNNLTRI
jgi:hypothetical protein